MAITVKELEDVKLEIIENIETILRVEDVAVSEMDKTAVVKMLIMSAALVGVAIEYASEDEAITVKELEEGKLEILKNIKTILCEEDGTVAEMDKTAVVKMLIMSAALIGVAIEYTSEDEAMCDEAEFEAISLLKFATDN